MTGRLVIDEVHAERFGGLHHSTLSLGHDRLVVVHGPNESGKTTFATLLAWLLVGPTGSRDEALRFGKPNDHVSGRLTGSVNGEPVRIDGSFKLLQRGLPNTNGIVVNHGGHQRDLATWRTLIGGIDANVLTATYRMWGADLHSDDTVLAEVTQAALAGLSGNRRIGDVVAQLQKLAQEFLTARAEGVESFSTLGVRRTALEADIKAIAANAGNFHQFQQRLAEVTERLQTSRLRAAELAARVATIDALQSVTQERQREGAITDQLASMDTVPEAWLPLVVDLDRFVAAAAAADQTDDEARAAERALRAAVAHAGLTDDEVEPLRVTHATVTAVQVRSTRLDAARTAVTTAEAALRSAEDTQTTAEAEAQRALSACPEVQAETLATRPLTDPDVRGLRTAIADWATAERQVVNAQTALSGAQQRLDVAAGERDRARDRWERFGTGVTAQQWRATPVPVAPVAPAAPNPAMTTTWSRSWLPAAVAGAVAVLAVLVLPRWVAVGVTAVSFAALVTVLRRARRTSVPDAPTPTPTAPLMVDPALDAERLEVANAVIAAELGWDQAQAEVQRHQADLDRVRRDAEHPRAVVATEGERLGLTVADTPAATTDLVERAITASGALMALATAQHGRAQAQRAVTAAQADVAALLDDLSTTLADAGVPTRLPGEAAADAVDLLRQVTELATQQQLAHQAAVEARQAVDRLTTSLGATATDHSRAWLVAEAQRLAALHAERQRLVAERDQLNHTINTRFREHPAAKELAAERRSEAELAAEREQRAAERAEAEDERDDLNRQLGELRQAMEQLMQRDELADKRLQLGMVVERADEQLLAGVVATVARTLLARTTAERRRTHQPALVARAGSLLASVATDWQQLLVDPTDSGSAEVTVVDAAGAELAATRLSTGARALTHLALRLATAELDAERRRLRFPIICDDPLVHLDDDRAQAVMPLLARAADDGHQVIVFTCHGRTVDAARAAGARVVQLG